MDLGIRGPSFKLGHPHVPVLHIVFYPNCCLSQTGSNRDVLARFQSMLVLEYRRETRSTEVLRTIQLLNKKKQQLNWDICPHDFTYVH